MVYVGEYAAHDAGRKNTLRAALAEAAHMTAMERNGDVVRLASYAPLLAKQGHTQWLPDLIYFDNTKIAPSVGYYVQQLFALNAGDQYLAATVSGEAQTADPIKPAIAVSCVVDSKTGDRILKIVSESAVPLQAQIDLAGADAIQTQALCTVLGGQADMQNLLGKTPEALPKATNLNVAEHFAYEVPATSLSVIRVRGGR